VKFKIGETVYDGATLDDLTLKMVLQLEKETREMGRSVTLGDVQVMAEQLDALKTDRERSMHEATPWVLAVTIWASRRLAGEVLTFEQAIDFPMGDLTFLKEPQDHRPPVNPTKARTRKGSGPAANQGRDLSNPKTSRPVSIAG